ncbi:MAG: peptidoglycan DD-metalloendopeptidase family protein [Cyclobacteriaceae bacterium]|nr:peptidoglycan DD-metalloendopeptidase family protein [Cyclobacteriaceae bacterium]
MLLLAPSPVIAQQKSKTELEQEKKKNIQKIVEAENILKQTGIEKEATLGQLSALTGKIQAQENLMRSLTEELGVLDLEIGRINIIVGAMEDDLEMLKEEYAAMIYAASKANKGYEKLIFVFSAQTFNQLIMRLQYMNQYTETRKTQVEQIQIVKEELTNQRKEIQVLKKEQQILIDEQKKQQELLLSDRQRQSQLIAQLNLKERELRAEMKRRTEENRKLDEMIEALVKESMAVSVDMKEITGAFERNRKKLKWPASGLISGKFGRHPHPVLKGNMVENLGIEIQTGKDAPVKTVFEGQVKAITSPPGLNYAVLIQHGDYFTVYANLKEVKVKKMQLVKAEDVIGTVYTNSSGVSELQFQVWKNFEKLNPEAWLMQR